MSAAQTGDASPGSAPDPTRGADPTISPDATLADGVWPSARNGAVVRGAAPPMTVVAGIPAQIVVERATPAAGPPRRDADEDPSP